MKTILWIVAIIITGACVLTTVEASASGGEVNKLITEGGNLKEVQVNLNRELLKASSLGNISDKAVSMGFVKPEKTVYINKEPEFAAR